jgi:hypothetical protein
MKFTVDKIMADYALLCAEVLYNKNLRRHLNKIDLDITYLNILLLTKPKCARIALRLFMIRDELVKMKVKIQGRIKVPQK